MTRFSRPILALFAGLAFAATASVGFPGRAHAIFGVADVVFDPSSFFQMIVDWGVQEVQSALSDRTVQKEYIFDNIARFAAQAALQSMAQSMTNWAASGFEGSPSFETDFKNSMLRVGDTVANDFTRQLQGSDFIRTPFGTRVAQAVQDNYYRVTGPQAFDNLSRYTLADTCENHEAFLGGDFSACGPSGWLQAWWNPANNPLGAQVLTEDQLAGQIGSAINQRRTELDWGQGFLSWKGDCTAYAGSTAFNQDPSVPLHDQDECLDNRIETPGSVVAHSVNKFAVDIGVDFSVNADEINEIIGTFFTQLIEDTLFNEQGGLAASARYERPPVQTPPPQAVSALRQSFDIMRSKLGPYRTNWNSILVAAERAERALASCTRDGAAEALEEIRAAIARANAELDRADLTEQKLNELEGLLGAAQSTNGDFQAVIAQYQAFQASGVAPSPQEIVDATTQATDSQTPSGEESLITKMNRYSRGCILFGGLFGD